MKNLIVVFLNDDIVFIDADSDFVTVFRDDVGVNTINLDSINLDDDNSDEADPETIHVRLIA